MKLKAGLSTEINNCDALILKFNKYTVFFLNKDMNMKYSGPHWDPQFHTI